MKSLTGMAWLRHRMTQLDYPTLQTVATVAGMNRGNLYRYFTFQTRPSIDVLPVLAYALDVHMKDILRALEVEEA